MTTYAVTAASGQLGRLVLDALLEKVAATDVVALARDPAKLSDYARRGVSVRVGDYDQPETLATGLAGVDRLLLISGSALGERPRQHQAVIDAAKAAGVSYIAYTSILHADRSPIKLGAEHRATEASLAASGLAYDLLRNGWYNENYIHSLKAQVAAGEITGAQGEGKINSASRADLAEGAAAVLVNGKGGDIYELAGDHGWTLAEFAAEVSRQAGKPVAYRNYNEEDYAQSLVAIGFPEYIAKVIANSGYSTSLGALEESGGTLGRLIGRPTTPIAETIRAALL
ncbi:MAG: SDR family oxidoreductase [Candidatus Andeanibacterium colombiense]|uniref:SDR family oxidoreductase n=1 Tax=Candidatus Andeanibacterium colombiense TaxID=3121345 RepID=A0AAJ6BQH7_9SPHN|nr:MAG: SDR family oxidoreductase [Sphingomonadaceae bacterium]